jgi:hypothetical protein
MRGLGLPGWARGRDGADFDEAETHAGKAIDGFAVLVETGGKADAVRKLQAHDFD